MLDSILLVEWSISEGRMDQKQISNFVRPKLIYTKSYSTLNYSFILCIYCGVIVQGRRNQSGQSGHGLTSFGSSESVLTFNISFIEFVYKMESVFTFVSISFLLLCINKCKDT